MHGSQRSSNAMEASEVRTNPARHRGAEITCLLGRRTARTYLVVDFQVASTSQELLFGVAVAVYLVKDVFEAVWNDTAEVWRVGQALHRVRLARAGLAVLQRQATVDGDGSYERIMSPGLSEVRHRACTQNRAM